MVLSDRRLVVVAFVLLVVFWGSSFPVIKVALGYSPPVLFAGARTLLCGLLVLPAALMWGGDANLRRDWAVHLLLAAFNVLGFMGLQTLAILYMPSGPAAVVIYVQPILVGLLGYLFLGEQLSTAKVVGLLLGFFGVVAVSVGSFSGASLGTPLGVVIGLGSAVAWTLGTVYFKKYGERLSITWAVAAQFALGGVLLTGFGFVLESVSAVSLTGTFLASLLYVALAGTALAWVLWLGLVRAGEASRVAAYVFFVPLVSILLGVLFLNEALSFWLLAGAALIVLGTYLVNRKQPAIG